MESVREGKKTKDRGAFPSSPGCLFMGQESFSHIELRNTRGIMGQLFNCCVTVTPYINFCIKELKGTLIQRSCLLNMEIQV